MFLASNALTRVCLYISLQILARSIVCYEYWTKSAQIPKASMQRAGVLYRRLDPCIRRLQIGMNLGTCPLKKSLMAMGGFTHRYSSPCVARAHTSSMIILRDSTPGSWGTYIFSPLLQSYIFAFCDMVCLTSHPSPCTHSSGSRWCSRHHKILSVRLDGWAPELAGSYYSQCNSPNALQGAIS